LKCRLGSGNEVRLTQGLADRAAFSQRKGVRHGATDDNGVGFFEQRVDDFNLIGNLGTPKNDGERALRVSCLIAEIGKLLLDKEAADIGRKMRRDASRRGVRTVCRAKGIVDKSVREFGQRSGKL
jgi:hypothetical protein